MTHFFFLGRVHLISILNDHHHTSSPLNHRCEELFHILILFFLHILMFLLLKRSVLVSFDTVLQLLGGVLY